MCPPGRGRRPTGPPLTIFWRACTSILFYLFVFFPFILFMKETAPDHEYLMVFPLYLVSDGVQFMI